MEQELIFSNKNGTLHKRPRLTKLTEARKKAGYKSQGTIATALGISTLKYCSYESGKEKMPKKIAEKLSALLNISIQEIMSVDYAKKTLSKEATTLLNKVFKLISDLDRDGIQRLNACFDIIHKENGYFKYRLAFFNCLREMPSKKARELKNKFNKKDEKILFGSRNMFKDVNTDISYDSVELLLESGLLPENQLKDFIKYFNIIK